MRAYVLAILALSSSFARPLFAIDVIVRSAVAGYEVKSNATITATGVMTRDAQTPVQSSDMDVPGQLRMDLTAGAWRFEVDAPGWFHAGTVHTVGGSNNTPAVILIWPMGTLIGKFKTTDEKPLAGLSARWATRQEGRDSAPDGDSPCLIAGDEYRCAVPASSSIDVKLAAPGYVSRFLTGVKVAPGKATQAPPQRFQRGVGVYGWVAAGSNLKFDSKSTRVRLTAIGAPSSQQPLEATVDERGLFVFAGVDPGAYQIVAFMKAGSAESDEREIVVRQDRETELLRPLALEMRVPFHVNIAPPQGADGKGWRVTLRRPSRGTTDVSVVAQSRSNDAGIAPIPNVAAGTYELSVTPESSEVAFVSRTIEVPRDNGLTIEVQTSRVRGTVTLNDRPLAGARLWIGGKYHVPAATLTTDTGGNFEGVVPFEPDAVWTITTSATSPTIERTVSQRPTVDEEGLLRLDIAIPSASIEGTVVDTNGSPATRGTVTVMRKSDSDSDLMQARVGSDGRFELVGLDTGDYSIYAEGFGRRSKTTTVSVAENDAVTVTLKLGDSLHLSGRLTTEDGLPVAGANVTINSVEVPSAVWIPRRTSASGEFDTWLAEGTRTIDVLVAAPGFAYKIFRAPLTAEQQLVIVVRQNGGSLDLNVPSLADDPSGRLPYLLRNGVALPLLFLLSGGGATVSSQNGGSTLHAPNVEHGAYGLCFATPSEIVAVVPESRCAFGNLTPFGNLSLASR